MFFFFSFFCSCDVAESWQINFQDPATPVAEGMLFFHNYIIFFLIFIGIAVLWLLNAALETNSSVASKFSHSSELEVIWTLIPAVILLFIAVPSFVLLYSLDEQAEPQVTLKIVGHQWYWSYEYTDFIFPDTGYYNSVPFEFDSYMLTLDSLVLGSFRLLEVDNRVVLPINTHIRLIITSSDVIHCWTIPSFGLKVDATPGRLSQASLFLKRIGVYYGQCSEICGVNHGFMPIVVSGVSKENFELWVFVKNLLSKIDN